MFVVIISALAMGLGFGHDSAMSGSVQRERLPIDDVLPQVLDALRRAPSVVLQAPTGAGKTTRVPPALQRIQH
ncbi:MAG TPA: hypothetical protein PLV92_20015, partial [Pirellulaceae bacterium]|nr:hypothetical protein [Pirellulaceae bacterium]